MYLDKDREIIETSTHNIPDRLKEIDLGYFLVRNHRTHQFEVHHSEQIGNTLALNIPYDELDIRTLNLVKSSRIEYAEKIFKEMELHNEKLEQDEKSKRKDMYDTVCKDIHKYVTNHESKDTIDTENYFGV